jgi:hypothetical protein
MEGVFQQAGVFCELRLIGLLGSSLCVEPEKLATWPTKDSHLADALASHPAIHLLLPNGSIRKKKRMIKISIEVKSGAARFKVASQAESIEGALEIAKRYNSGKECKVVFPIDPEGFFVEDDLDKGGVVGKIAA